MRIPEFEIIENKRFSQFDVQIALGKMEDVEKQNPEWAYEYLAWGFSFSSEKCVWGTYNGPMSTGTDASGILFEQPNMSMITAEAVTYWNERREQVKNPLMALTYISLTWDFYEKYLLTRKPHDLYLQFVETLFKIIEQDYFHHPVVARTYFDILFQLIGTNSSYLERAKQCLDSFVRSWPLEDESMGVWCIAAQNVIKYPKSFSKELDIPPIRSLLEERWAVLSKQGMSVFMLMDLLTLICELYQIEQNESGVISSLDRMCELLDKVTNLNGMQIEAAWSSLSQICGKFNYKKGNQYALVKSQESAKKALQEMEHFEKEIGITDEQWKGWLSMMTAGTSEEQIERMVFRHIPQQEDVVAELEKNAREAPFYFMISTKLFVGDGYPGSVIGSWDTDKEGHIMQNIYQRTQIESVFLANLINTLIENGVLTQEVLNDKIDKSPLLDDSRKMVMKTVCELYMNQQYMMFCHLIMPLLERMIRKILELMNYSVIKPQKNNLGFQVRTLDDLLREKVIDEVLAFKKGDNSVSMYLRALLTDQRAMNYRNLLCHGLVNPQSFGRVVADRLLHCLLLLLMVKYIN